MALNERTLAHLRTRLAAEDVDAIERNARKAQEIERRYLYRTDQLFESILTRVMDELTATGQLPTMEWIETRIGALLLEHELMTTIAAVDTVRAPEYVRAARPHWPSDLARVRALWDLWRRTGKLPGYTRKQAAAIKVLYIRRVQQLWQREGQDFIHGRDRRVAGEDWAGTVWNPAAFDRKAATEAVRKAVAVPRARARTIVETETTRYYNTTRVNQYNTFDNVVAYLYVAVRDAATTRWCRPGVRDGKCGRGGIVFMKGTVLLSKNTPPCHWNCRGELLPLSRHNPAHRRLIDDMSIRAENVKLEPLPPGWNS